VSVTAEHDRTLEQLLTVADLCQLCQVSRRTVYRAMAAGQLRPTRLGRALRFTQADVEAWIEAGRQL
jgi:excisionase family DNA binding protein